MLLVLAVGVVSMPGCSGCNQDPDERLADKIKREEERQKKKKPKPNFVSPGTAILPGKYPDLDSKTPEDLKELTPEERALYSRSRFNRLNRTKLGHWLETSTPAIANNFDQKGQINSVPMRGTVADKVPGTNFEIATERSFSLVKGQWKYLPSTIYLPKRSNAQSANMNVTLATSNDALPLHTVQLTSTQTMAGFQYHMILLSNRPQQIRYLQFTDSVQIKQSDLASADTPPLYHVVSVKPGLPLPLPRNVLNWTTTAYLVWDDLDPDDLDPDQQQALVDWLHFGGQLILSGPDCLSKLEASFLADYLPAQSEGKTELDSAAFDPLNENWSVPNRNNPAEKRTFVVTESKPVIGIEFKPHVAASYVTGTGSLAIERMIGRGRVVATAFSLTSPTVKSWGSFQSFFSGALLRKPHRKFGMRNEVILFDWARDLSTMYDPLIGSTVRFISRDLAIDGTPSDPSSETDLRLQDEALNIDTPPLKLSKRVLPERNTDDTRYYGGFKADAYSGVGGWSDSSAIAHSARDGLKSAAGITPPSADLILKMLGVYLLVLVPVNWMIFRAMGKVEWAWAMVPIIAIAGAITVVKVASLDIGFARSNTQVSLLEIHGDYHRGHLCQYSALYTSLSTNYAIELDNATGIALPLGLNKASDPNATPQRLWLQQSLTNRTENFQIQSNSTKLLHAEWIQDVGGEFRVKSDPAEPDFENLKLENTTTVDLALAGVIARDEDGNYYGGWIGDLSADEAIDVSMDRKEKFDLPQLWAGDTGLIKTLETPQQILSNFDITPDDRILMAQIEQWIEERPRLSPYLAEMTVQSLEYTGSVTAEPSIGREQFMTIVRQARSTATESLVGNVLLAVLDNLELGKGEIRLLGICENQIGNTQFDPESTQSTGQTLVVAHLRQPDLPPAQRDLNSILDFTRTRSNIDYEKDFSDESFDGTLEQE